MANIFTEIIRYLSKKFVFYGAIYYHTGNDSMPENTSLTSGSLTHSPHKELHNLNGDIIFPVQNNNLSSVLDMVHMCEDDGS